MAIRRNNYLKPTPLNATKRRSTIGNATFGPPSKKANDNGYVLILWDESDFSFVPNICRTWSSVRVASTLIEAPKTRSSAGLGFLAVTLKRKDIAFRFNLIPHGLDTEECVY